MASMSGCIYLEKSQAGGVTRIRVDVQKLDESIENNIIKVPYPVVSQSNQNTTRPQTKYKDIKRLSHVLTIQGYIHPQTSESANSSSQYYDERVLVKGSADTLTAPQAKNALIYYVLYPYGDITVYWRGAAFFSGVAGDATPSTALTALMDSTINNRLVTTAFEKVMFSDEPGKRADKAYWTSSASANVPSYEKIYDVTEVNAEKYLVQINLVRGVNF